MMVGDEAPKAPDLLVLLPSGGAGGGIEAYVAGVVEAALSMGCSIHTVTLATPYGGRAVRWRQQLHFATQALRVAFRLQRVEADTQVLCFHPGLAPVGMMVAAFLRGRTTKAVAGRAVPLRVFFYGADIWGASLVKRAFWRVARFEPVTISGFSGGALARAGNALMLAPGLTAHRYQTLLALPARPQLESPTGALRVLSVFRLADYRAKGGPTLLQAVEHLRADGHDITLTIAGVADPAFEVSELHRLAYPWLTVIESPSHDELLRLYAAADLFVLATRLRTGATACGEGFGIVLIEAALAGVPVITPAFGGGHAAFVEGVTGLAPVDESTEALEGLLEWAAAHPRERSHLGLRGRQWAREAFSPDAYRTRVAQVLFGWELDAPVISHLMLS